MIGQPEFDPEEIAGPIIVRFCNHHWETVEEFVKDRGVNPLVRCLAECVEESSRDDKYATQDVHEAVSRSNTQVRHKYWDTMGPDREVESKLVLWTLDAVSDTINENIPRLRYELLEQLEGAEHETVRCAESEEADLLAYVRDDTNRYLFAFKLVGVSTNDADVLDTGFDISIEVELSSRITPFQSFARQMNATPLLAIHWADDPRFFVHDLRRESERITIQEPTYGGLLWEDTQFTPLPIIADLPEVVTEDRWETAVDRRRKKESAKSEMVAKLYQRLR